MTRTRPVAIILVNWNNEPDTAACLESCGRLDYPAFSVIVVDNGSADGSPEKLRQRFPGLEVIETGRNLGFAGGNNVGMGRALETGAEYVWLLNNDTQVERGALSALVEVAEQDRTVGMVGSKVLYFDHPGRIWYAGGIMDDHAPYRCSHRGVNEVDAGQYDDATETGYVTGCSLLVRREVIERIGLLDEGMFLYFEDTDWGVRARRGGWRLIYAPRSVVLHKASASMGGMGSPRMLYYLARNLLYFIRRNYPRAIVRAFGFDLFQHVLVTAKKGRWAAAGWALRGIVDFLRGRRGPH
jgi:GT2 family glycosyltransferase